MSGLVSTLDLLRKLKPDLVRHYHVSTIGVFGSVLRGDFNNEKSDLDIVVEFSRPVGIEFIDLGDFLEVQFKRKIDLVSRKAISTDFFSEFEGDIIYV